MSRTPEQQRGLDFEQSVADSLGGKVIPGSGNQWHSKSDVSANGLLVSCKSEKTYGYSRVIRYLKQAVDDAQGTGEIPVLALEDVDDREQVIIMRLSDFSRAFSEEVSIPANAGMSKGQEKRDMINTPLLLRE